MCTLQQLLGKAALLPFLIYLVQALPSITLLIIDCFQMLTLKWIVILEMKPYCFLRLQSNEIDSDPRDEALLFDLAL
jgi:hypothetical protein